MISRRTRTVRSAARRGPATESTRSLAVSPGLLPAALVVLAACAASASASQQEKALVVEPEAELWKKPGKKGEPLAVLGQGVKVRLTGKKKGKFLEARTTEPFEVAGWLLRDGLGCRMTEDTVVKDSPDKGVAAGDETVLLRKGAAVRILKKRKGWLKIETRPYPVQIFHFDPAGGDEMTAETVYTGYVIGGWVPEGACSIDQEPYYDSTPQDGTLFALDEEAPVFSRKPKEEDAAAAGKKLRLPGRASKYCRWVETTREGAWSGGYTDGPVVIKGWTMKDDLFKTPNTNPLNIIFMKDMKDCELLAASKLRELESGEIIATLPGGMDVYKVGVDYEGCIVRTPPPIVVEGLVPCKHLRNLGNPPEKVIDGTKKNPQVTFPERGPKSRKGDTQEKKKGKKPR